MSQSWQCTEGPGGYYPGEDGYDEACERSHRRSNAEFLSSEIERNPEDIWGKAWYHISKCLRSKRGDETPMFDTIPWIHQEKPLTSYSVEAFVDLISTRDWLRPPYGVVTYVPLHPKTKITKMGKCTKIKTFGEDEDGYMSMGMEIFMEGLIILHVNKKHHKYYTKNRKWDLLDPFVNSGNCVVWAHGEPPVSLQEKVNVVTV